LKIKNDELDTEEMTPEEKAEAQLKVFTKQLLA